MLPSNFRPKRLRSRGSTTARREFSGSIRYPTGKLALRGCWGTSEPLKPGRRLMQLAWILLKDFVFHANYSGKRLKSCRDNLFAGNVEVCG